MADKEESVPSKRGPAFVAGLLLLLPLLYLLSTGPVILLMEKTNGFGGHISWDALRQFYAPLTWLYDHTFMKAPIDLYLHLWGIK